MKPNFNKRYLLRFTLGMAGYVILLFVAIFIGQSMGAGLGRVLIGLLPIPAILFVAWAAILYSREADEFARRQLNESLAIGFAFGSAIVASYGVLDSFGAPRVSVIWAFAAYMMCWLVGSFIVARRYRS